MKKIYIILLITLSLTVQASDTSIIKAAPSQNTGIDAELMVMSVGPSEEIKGTKNPNRLWRMFRITNYISEIYLTAYIEEISIGEENSLSIHNTRKIESELPGQMTEIKWLNPTELEFKVHKETYRLSNINENNIKLRLIKSN